MTDKIQRDPLVEAARARIDQLAVKMCAKIDPLHVAGTFLTVGVALVTGVMGKEGAAHYMHELAAELDGDDDPGWGGHA